MPKREDRMLPSELLAFYKSRVEDFEKERGALLDSVEKCSVQAAELHRLEWENQKRTDEIRELQKERQRLLVLQAENDELRLQEIEDRKRIQQLLNYEQQHGATSRHYPNVQHQSIDTLMLKIESLQAQLNEQKHLAAEHVAALVEDRRIREQEEAAHRAHMNQQLEQLAQKLHKNEELLRNTTKDYILARRDKQAAEEKAIQAEAALAQEKKRSSEQILQVRRKAAEESRDLQQAADTKLEDVSSNLRKQLKVKEDEVINLMSVHTTMKAQYEKRFAELEARVAKLQESNKQLDVRRHLDMEGFTADVTHLRKMLNAIDRKLHEMRLVDRLGEDDRLDTILEHLRRKAPSLSTPTPTPAVDHSDVASSNDTKASDGTSAKGELSRSLKEIKGKIRGMEDKLAAKKKLLAGTR